MCACSINIVHVIKIASSEEDSRSSIVESESVTEVDELSRRAVYYDLYHYSQWKRSTVLVRIHASIRKAALVRQLGFTAVINALAELEETPCGALSNTGRLCRR